jgi:hypothetical protein
MESESSSRRLHENSRLISSEFNLRKGNRPVTKKARQKPRLEELMVRSSLAID